MKHQNLAYYGLFFAFLTACSSTPRLEMEAQRAPVDESVVTRNFSKETYKKLMVIPPSGTVRGQYDSIIAIFEKEFLRAGITVISGAITGRVVLETATDKKSEEGQRLSDAERALVMAKKTGADAILQIGEWNWSKDAGMRRFFIFDKKKDAKNYREVSRNDYKNYVGLRIAFSSDELRFVGRLTNVENGEVIASFDITSPANFNLPERYVAAVEETNEQSTIVTESFPYSGSSWLEDAKKTTEMVVIKTVCSRILTPEERAVNAAPPAQPAAPHSAEPTPTEAVPTSQTEPKEPERKPTAQGPSESEVAPEVTHKTEATPSEEKKAEPEKKPETKKKGGSKKNASKSAP